jgi:hypothetical protein
MNQALYAHMNNKRKMKKKIPEVSYDPNPSVTQNIKQYQIRKEFF